ncbi:MAG: small multi-drug export protein [Planctomycetota bacterium]|jgi:uncharacterized membrane protein|nr:small multi-drug export protein [Planctomycetota bacterium]
MHRENPAPPDEDLSEIVPNDELGWKTRAFSFLLPLGAFALFLGLSWMIYGKRTAVGLLALSAITFFVLGKLVVFAGIGNGVVELLSKVGWEFPLDLGPYHLAALLVYLDMSIAMVIAYNLDILYRIPVVGQKLRKTRLRSLGFFESKRWLKKLRMLGVVLFVCFPFTGTGAIGGTFVGQMLGLARQKILLLVAIGSCLGAFGMAWGADHLGHNLENFWKQPWVVAATVLFLLGLLIFLLRALRGGSSGQGQ